jgi:hypothetical protein
VTNQARMYNNNQEEWLDCIIGHRCNIFSCEAEC